jgi:hypothetical protein
MLFPMLVMAFLFVCFFPSNAHAYLDPGTGSYLLQMLIAGALGALFVLKVFWKQVKAAIKNLFTLKSNG